MILYDISVLDKHSTDCIFHKKTKFHFFFVVCVCISPIWKPIFYSPRYIAHELRFSVRLLEP